jgi:hypothetical protein
VPPPRTTPLAVYVAVPAIQSGLVPVTDVILAFVFTVIVRCAETVPPQPPVIVYIILHEPADTPVTNPVDEFTVATDELLLLHAPVPPLSITVLAVYVAVAPIHKGLVPVTDAILALGLIVTPCCADTVPPQPPIIVYIILHEPADIPVTNPVDELTVATAVLLLLHAPVPPPRTTPVVVYVAVAPIHSGVVPVTDAIPALGLIVTDCCADTVPPQPPVIVYIILHEPAATPVTTPDALTVATAVLLLLHAPVPPLRTTPVVVYVAVPVIHSGLVPVTDAILALGLIVTDCCADTVPPQPPVIVYIILHVPADTPVTNPAGLTVATPVLLLLHAPVPPPRTTPVVVYVAVPVIHSGLVPVTDAILALGLIVTDCCADTVPPQPPVIVYIILHVPADTPVTNPVDELTVATAVLLLLHAPVPPPRTTPLAV